MLIIYYIENMFLTTKQPPEQNTIGNIKKNVFLTTKQPPEQNTIGNIKKNPEKSS